MGRRGAGPVNSARQSLAGREFLLGGEVRAILGRPRVSLAPGAGPATWALLDGMLATTEDDRLGGTSTLVDGLVDPRLTATAEPTAVPETQIATDGLGTQLQDL